MKRDAFDIVIAGGGIAGLSAAGILAKDGFSIACIDPAPPVLPAQGKHDLRSTAFLMPSVQLLADAGLWDQLEPFAQPLKVMRIADSDDEGTIRFSADFDAKEIGQEQFGFNLPNIAIRRALIENALNHPGIVLIAPDRVESCTPRSAGALINLASGRQLSAPLTIAADGRDSSLRQSAGIDVRNWRYGQKAVVFSVSHEVPHGDVSTEIHRSGGPFTLVPLPDAEGRHYSAVVWMESGPKAAALMGMDNATFAEALNHRSCGILGKLEPASGRAIWPIIAQESRALSGPRLALIAEAAHVIPPIGAQGLNMSLRDLRVLRELLLAARERGADIGSTEILKAYERHRKPDIAARIRGVDILNRASMMGGSVLRDARLAGLKALYNARSVRDVAMKAGLGR